LKELKTGQLLSGSREARDGAPGRRKGEDGAGQTRRGGDPGRESSQGQSERKKKPQLTKHTSDEGKPPEEIQRRLRRTVITSKSNSASSLAGEKTLTRWVARSGEGDTAVVTNQTGKVENKGESHQVASGGGRARLSTTDDRTVVEVGDLGNNWEKGIRPLI